MRATYKHLNFTAESANKLTVINSILDEYQDEGYNLTVRQLYYQLVARGYIENSQRSYKKIADLVNNGRLAGVLDWDMIVDRGRETVIPNTWKDPAEIVNDAAKAFALDKWKDQPNHVEIMVEKQALEGVLTPVCESLQIPFTANKGYSSSSTMYEAGQRLYRKSREGKTLWVLYLGDHDPSGIDMTRDVEERLNLFTAFGYVNIKRLALNIDQVESLHPPENPAKETDSRYAAYIALYGNSSWELDALDPRQLASLVTNEVEALRDKNTWTEATEREEAMRKELQDFVDSYQERGNS